jgi:hypothetical protein
MYENPYYAQTTYEQAHMISNRPGDSSSHVKYESIQDSSHQTPTQSELERAEMKLYATESSDPSYPSDPFEHPDLQATP